MDWCRFRGSWNVRAERLFVLTVRVISAAEKTPWRMQIWYAALAGGLVQLAILPGRCMAQESWWRLVVWECQLLRYLLSQPAAFHRCLVLELLLMVRALAQQMIPVNQ